MTLNSIDSFINVPLLVSLGLGVVLLLLLLIMKLRNTSKSSFIFFVVVGIIVLGSAYTYLTQTYFYFVFTVILAEVLILPYVLLKAFDNPKKREEKLAAKKAAEIISYLEEAINDKATSEELKIIVPNVSAIHGLECDLELPYKTLKKVK